MNKMRNRIKKLVIKKDAAIKDAIRAIMRNGCGITFLTDDDGRFVSVVTDGNIRKAMLEGRQLSDKVINIASSDPLFVRDDMSDEEILEFLKRKRGIRHKVQQGGTLKIPVVDREEKIVNVLFVSIKNEKEHIIECDLKDAKKTKRLTGVRSILVTGGAGYLGSILCGKLLDQDYKVKVLDNLMHGDEGIRQLYGNANFQLIKGDIRNLETVVESIKDVDAVIHLAAIVGDPVTLKFPQSSIDVNYLATKAIVEACKYYQVNRFIFASTCSVYGRNPDVNRKLTVDSKPDPVSLYAKMKLESEKAILSLADDNFSPIILRMATLYGLSPRMRFDLVVNLLTAEAVVKRKISIFGGGQWRPFLHVDDAARAYIECIKLPFNRIRSRIVNLGADSQNYQICQVGRMIKKSMPEIRINFSRKKIDERNYRVQFDDVVKLFDFDARRTLPVGIAEVRNAILAGSFLDYRDPKYSNVKI